MSKNVLYVLGLSLLAAGSADAEIIKGVLFIRGAEMS
jgi:hypothetical protein